MTPETGHLVRDIQQIAEDKRALYEQLQDEQVALAAKLLKNRDEAHLTRQQVRRLQRLVEKRNNTKAP
jgi:hypothetical protein